MLDDCRYFSDNTCQIGVLLILYSQTKTFQTRYCILTHLRVTHASIILYYYIKVTGVFVYAFVLFVLTLYILYDGTRSFYFINLGSYKNLQSVTHVIFSLVVNVKKYLIVGRYFVFEYFFFFIVFNTILSFNRHSYA